MKKLLIYTILILALSQGWSQHKASYYAKSFHGKKTASGQIFRNDLLTCAHKTLPFGTLLKVTNVDNCKSVIVVVNDRGPFIKSRIIDLSMAAFKQIAPIKKGICNVIIEEI